MDADWQVKKFLMQLIKQQLFALFHKILLKSSIGMFIFDYINTMSNFHPDQLKSAS